MFSPNYEINHEFTESKFDDIWWQYIECYNDTRWNRDSSVGIATCYGLDDRGIEFESWKGQEFSIFRVVQTGSGVHPTSCLVGNGDFSPGVKRPWREADRSPPAATEVKKCESILPVPHTP
jgi:hypothetical protein